MADESACRPDSVRTSPRPGDHPLGARCWTLRATYPQARRAASAPARARRPFLVLLPVGFTEPPRSPAALVSSYLTVSPLPAPPPRVAAGGLFSVALSRTSPWVAVSHHRCSVESGLSSTSLMEGRRGRPADSFAPAILCPRHRRGRRTDRGTLAASKGSSPQSLCRHTGPRAPVQQAQATGGRDFRPDSSYTSPVEARRSAGSSSGRTRSLFHGSTSCSLSSAWSSSPSSATRAS